MTYSDRASNAASHARSKIKNTEIAIRKMAAKLRDIKRGLAFEDQPPVQAAADHWRRLRSGLLSRMFAKDIDHAHCFGRSPVLGCAAPPARESAGQRDNNAPIP